MIRWKLFFPSAISGFLSLLGCQSGSKVDQLEMKAEWAVDSFQAPVISQDQFVKLLEDHSSPGILIVDVRAKEEFLVSNIPGAIHWNPYLQFQIPDEVQEAASNQLPIVIYCSIGYRSGHAADLVIESNLDAKNIYNLKGGIFQWANEDRPLEGNSRVHPYDKNWGLYLREELRHQIR